MKTFLTAVALVLGSWGAMAQTAPSDPTQSAASCSSAFFNAMLTEDSNLLDKVSTPDFQIISFDGQVTERDLLMQALGGGYLVLDAGAVSGATTRTYNDNTAVVTGNWKIKGNLQSRTLDATAFFSLVCVKQNNGWRVASVQLTPLR